MTCNTNGWSGWKFVTPRKAKGGEEARSARRAREKLARQKAVMELICETRPDAVKGDHDLVITPDEVNSWLIQIQDQSKDSPVELRDRTNFLVSVLAQGGRELGWQVNPPAPISYVNQPSSVFSPSNFKELQGFRKLQTIVMSSIHSPDFVKLLNEGNPLKGHRSINQEMLSWGLIIYQVITLDGLLNYKVVNALPMFVDSLTIDQDLAWIDVFDWQPKGLKKIPPRTRYFLSSATVGLLLRHKSLFGISHTDDYQHTRSYIGQAWTQFRKACGIEHYSLKEFIQLALLAAYFDSPGYLVNGLSVIRGTAITAERWEQLIRNGVKSIESQQGSIEELDQTNTHLEKPWSKVVCSLQSSRSILTELRQLVYSRRQDKKLSFKERTESFENLLTFAKDAAPIVFYVCAWIYSLHKKKLALSTQYNYLNRIGFDLFQAIGNDPIDDEHLDVLRSAYASVFDAAASPDDRAYKLVLLKQFHNFMVTTVGITKIEFGIDGYEFPKQSNADANFITETEFRCIASTLKTSDLSELGLARYWIFVLGYRAGIRASEAVSIQLKDIQRTYHLIEGSDLTLLVRPNQYVNIKSSDSRRQLPLHLLLTLEERQAFERYVRERSEILGVQSKMLFSSDGMSLRPIEDADIFPQIHEAMRNVTGCKALRYHHLRHSLANHLLAEFHNVQTPYTRPEHLSSLMQVLSNHPTRKGLYYIAQLLGHASPLTTLHSYIHIHSYVYYHLRHRNPTEVLDLINPKQNEFNINNLAHLLEIKEDTLRQWKKRYGDRPIHWLSRFYKKSGLYREIEGEFRPYAESLKVEKPTRSLRTLTLTEFEKILTSSQSGMLPHEIESIFGLDDGAYEVLERAYARIVMVKTNKTKPNSKRNSYRHLRRTVKDVQARGWKGHFISPIGTMSPPHQLSEQKDARKVFERVAEQISNDELKSICLRQLRFFYQFHRGSDNNVFLKDAEQGVAFILWLSKVTPSAVGFNLVHRPSSISGISAQEQKEFWLDQLKPIKNRVNFVSEQISKKYKKEYGTAHLSFYKKGSASVSGGFGVRYALIMSSVVYLASLYYEKKIFNARHTNDVEM